MGGFCADSCRQNIGDVYGDDSEVERRGRVEWLSGEVAERSRKEDMSAGDVSPDW